LPFEVNAPSVSAVKATAATKSITKPTTTTSSSSKPTTSSSTSTTTTKPSTASKSVATTKPTSSEDDYFYDNSVTNDKNPLVYFNFSVSNEPAGKVIVELFADRAPKSANQFRKLCEKGYAGTVVSRFVHNYVLQGLNVDVNLMKHNHLVVDN
jgi:hypothetical protein